MPSFYSNKTALSTHQLLEKHRYTVQEIGQRILIDKHDAIYIKLKKIIK